jgi:hypothetical protein
MSDGLNEGVVGDTAKLMMHRLPDAPEAARASPEIDAFPQNAKVWEVTEAKRIQTYRKEPVVSRNWLRDRRFA